MNDDKDQNSKRSSEPNLPSEADENPWDDEGSGRTLMTEGPSFDLPSNIPSPITAPPPPVVAPVAVPPMGTKPRSKTMIGFGPPSPPLPGAAPAPAFGAPPPAAAPSAPAAPSLAQPATKALPFAPGGGMVPTPRSPPSSSSLQAVKAPPSSPALKAQPRPLGADAPRAAAAPRAGGAAGQVGTAGRAAPLRMPLPLPSARTGPSPTLAATPGSAPEIEARAPAPAQSSTSVMDHVAGHRGGATPPAPALLSSNPPPAVNVAWGDDEQQEDAATMAGATPEFSEAIASLPLRDDMMNPRHAPMASPGYARDRVDKDAETMALPSTKLVAAVEPDPEETTRAVSRDELIRHQDASVVVGDDAMGDEATLAVAPGKLADFGVDPSLGAAMADSLREGSQPHLPSAPGFPASQPYPNPHSGGPGMQQPPPSWRGEGPPPYYGGQQQQMGMQHQHPGAMHGYDPMLAQQQQYGAPPSSPGMPGPFPQSGQHPVAPQGYPMMYGGGYGPNANAPTGLGQRPGMASQPMGGQPAPWLMTQPSAHGMSGPSRFTPQVIMLVAVGAVCLAIFIIGIVLFVTTKF